ncbi:PREDICTED: free fatty acid receptor 3-like [Calidris pugnax]|uniref:free fatty acid receptor 3-like n=1 Tax=Calidris pugnax TaxID=198806 RepID=UPI00071D97E2|nr:PREDICTED: free fatty acid receptor 3-like [Calidris pugnax]
MWILAVYILTFIVGFPANVFTFVTLLIKACRRVSPSDLLLLNLTAADLLLLLFLPFKMAEAAADMTWPLPSILCPVANFVFFSSIYLSSLFLAALSVERYLGVVFPHHYKGRRRLCQVVAASVVFWLLACSLCSVVFIAQFHGGKNPAVANRTSTISSPGDPNPGGFNHDGFKISSPGGSNPGGFKFSNRDGSMDDVFAPHGSKPTKGSKISTPNFFLSHISTILDTSSPTAVPRHSNLPTSSAPGAHQGPTPYKCYDDFSPDQLSFVLPLRLTLFLVLFLLPFTSTIFCYVNFVRVLLSRPNIPLEKKQRAVGLAVATMVNFGVCFAPYNISHVVGFVEKKSPPWRVYALLLTSLNAALDPVIFYFSSRAVQKAMRGVVVAVGDKLRVVAGWWHQPPSPGVTQEEVEGSFR